MTEALMETRLIGAIGWSLIAFVWQGALIGAVAAFLLWIFRGSDPRLRYAFASLGLLVMIALPVQTAVRSYNQTAVRPASLSTSATFDSGVPSAPSRILPPSSEPLDTGFAATDSSGSVSWLHLVVAVWLAGVMLFSIRLAGGWLVVYRMSRRGIPVGENLARSIRKLARRLHVLQPVRARESALVDVPTVVGWLKPTILLPASAISGLAPEQLEAILAHELAHIRRHDYGVNLLQRLAETLFFYHPAVWWLSNRIRAEREMCADDLAVAVCGDAALYAGALRDLESVRNRDALAVAATGGSLKARVGRLLGQPPTGDRWSPAWIVVLLAVVLIVGGVGRPLDATEASAPTQSPEVLETSAATAQVEAPLPDVVELAPAAEQTASGELEEVVEDVAEARQAPEVSGELAQALGDIRIEIDPVEEPGTNVLGFTGGVSGVGGSFLGLGYALNAQNSPVRVITGQDGPAGFGPSDSWMGVTIVDGEDQGVLVQSVEPESPAADAGIEAGDQITELDGMRVVGVRQLTRMIQETPTGRTVPVTVVRDGQPRLLNVTLSAEPVQRALDQYLGVLRDFDVSPFGVQIFPPRYRLGLQVQDMTPELREFFGSDPDVGVLVTSVQEGTAAAEAGMLVGDVIVSAAGEEVHSSADLRRSAEIENNTVVLGIVREGSRREVEVTLDLPTRSLQIAP